MKRFNKIVTIIISFIFVFNLTAFGMPKSSSMPKSSGMSKSSMMGSSNKSSGAVISLGKIIKAYPKNFKYNKVNSNWGFRLGTGEKFGWTKNMGDNKIDLAMTILADPLVKAGLNVKKLNKSLWIYIPAATVNGKSYPNRLMKPLNVSNVKKVANGPLNALKVILNKKKSLISYFKKEGHYMLMLGDGYEIHWTEKVGSMAADMEFVVKAQSLVAAGLNTKKLSGSGWKFEAAGKGDSRMNSDQIVKEFRLKK